MPLCTDDLTGIYFTGIYFTGIYFTGIYRACLHHPNPSASVLHPGMRKVGIFRAKRVERERFWRLAGVLDAWVAEIWAIAPRYPTHPSSFSKPNPQRYPPYKHGLCGVPYNFTQIRFWNFGTEILRHRDGVGKIYSVILKFWPV